MGIGVAAPKAVTQNHGRTFLAVSMENNPNQPEKTIKGRRIAILAADGFDSSQLMEIKQALKSGGAQAEVVSKFKGMIKSADGKEVEVNKTFLTAASVMYDAVYIPGGKESIETLQKEGDVVEFINDTLKHYKAIAATGEGVDLLMMAPESKAMALDKSQSNGHITSDNGAIASRNAANIKNVAQEFIGATARHRHWTRTINEIKPPVPEAIGDRITIGS